MHYTSDQMKNIILGNLYFKRLEIIYCRKIAVTVLI